MTIRLTLALVALLALALGGCAPSLARVASEPPQLGADEQPDLKRCETLSKAEKILRYTTVGGASLAGTSGLGQIPLGDDKTARAVMAATTASFASLAALAEAERAELGTDFERECNP